MRSYWLLAAFVLALTTALLQNAALENFWYWQYWWFDIVMHYVGGLAVASLLISGLNRRHKPGAFVLAFTVVVIAWEVFEFIFGIPREANYAADTVLDLIVGSLGALTVYLIARKTVWR